MMMASNSRVWHIICLLLIVVLLCPFAYSKIIYVDDDAIGANDGSSWQSAYTSLQEALTDAEGAYKPIEIRVAQGIYKPYHGSWEKSTDSIASFQLINEVTIAGGYAGFGEQDPNTRNVELYETILSGDLNGDDVDVNDPCDMLLVQFNRGDNSDHVVKGSNTDASAILDGFTITGGHFMAVSMGPPTGGAGMYIASGSPTIINCIFTGNAASQAGGGVYNIAGSPMLIDCKFESNYAEFGAGMYNTTTIHLPQRSKPILISCLFNDNYSAREGGGMYNFKSDPNLTNCAFSHNFALVYGAGIYNSYSSIELIDTSFIENIAGSGGGIYSKDNSSLILSNCIIWKNTARGTGGGMCNADANSILLTNCLLSKNSAEQAGGGLAGSGNKTTFVNCTFSGNKVYGESTDTSKGGGFHAFGDVVLINCTFSGNWAQQGRAISQYSFSDLRLNNCILWDGGNEIFQTGVKPNITYSNIQGGWEGDDNVDEDPLFVDSGYWAKVNYPNIIVEPNDPNAVWIDGDYHLKSQAGRWDPVSQSWVQDDVTSPCIDAGDPNSPIGHEPFPNGGIINMGAYGGTVEASKSLNETSIYIFWPQQSMVFQTGGIAGVDGTYILSGQFQLTIDFGAGKARFSKVEAIATDHSEPVRKLDPNDFFNLTGLTGTISKGGSIQFTGRTADGSNVLLYITLSDEWISLKGQTTPPPNSADFFIFDLDAVAQRKYGGGTGEPNDPYQIATAEELMLLGESPEDYDKHFILTADIDLDPNLPGRKVLDRSLIAPDNGTSGSAFEGTPFTGVFDGNGFTIRHLTIVGERYLGLFGELEVPGEVWNLGVTDANIHSVGECTGILLASSHGGEVANCFVSGNVHGDDVLGGLVGMNGGVVRASFSTGQVSGDFLVGGLIGFNGNSLYDSYSMCAVSGNQTVGGLVGNNHSAFISNCYSVGTVKDGDHSIGGLVGNSANRARAVNSFWDIEASGQVKSEGGTGKTTAELQTASTFLDAGWDFVDETANGTEDIWHILEGQDYPRLWWEIGDETSP